MFVTELDNHLAIRKMVLGELRRITGLKFKDKILHLVKQVSKIF